MPLSQLLVALPQPFLCHLPILIRALGAAVRALHRHERIDQPRAHLRESRGDVGIARAQLLPQTSLCPFDGELPFVEQVAEAQEELDFLRGIFASARKALRRGKQRQLALPVADDVRPHAEQPRNLADAPGAHRAVFLLCVNSMDTGTIVKPRSLRMQFSRYWPYPLGKPARRLTNATKRTGFALTWVTNRIL